MGSTQSQGCESSNLMQKFISAPILKTFHPLVRPAESLDVPRVRGASWDRLSVVTPVHSAPLPWIPSWYTGGDTFTPRCGGQPSPRDEKKTTTHTNGTWVGWTTNHGRGDDAAEPLWAIGSRGTKNGLKLTSAATPHLPSIGSGEKGCELSPALVGNCAAPAGPGGAMGAVAHRRHHDRVELP